MKELTKTEIALARNRELLIETERTANIGGWEFDVKTMTQKWTEQTFHILEIDTSAGEPKVPQGMEFINPPYREMANNAIQRGIEFGEPYDQEWEITTFKGNKRWVHAVGEVRQENGKTVGLYGSFQDITDRKRTEEALRQSEEHFSKAFHASPAAITITRLVDGYFVDVNQSFIDLLEYNREEVIGRKSTEITMYSNPHERASLVKLLRQNGKVSNREVNLQTKTHKPRQVLVSMDIIRINNQDHILSTFMDISERKKAVESLRQSEELLRQSQAIAHVGSWELDLKTNKLTWSDEVYRIFGLNPQEFGATYQAFLDYVHPADREAVEAAYSGSVAQGRSGYEIEHRVIRKGTGEVRFVHEKGVNVKDTSGSIVRSIGMVQDITERKEIERKLEDYSKNLENLVEERTRKLRDAERLATIGQVAGMVGHDIKNPLQTIISELYLVKTEIDKMAETEAKEEMRESINSIEQQTSFIDKIIKDLQELERPLTPQLVEVDLCKAIPEAISSVIIPANIKKSVICSVSELKTKIDLTFLRRIMTNLVTNAVQAMPNGGLLTVKIQREDNSALVSVEDTGVGISKEAMGKLFTPLFTTKAKGQGFGLVAVKRMTEALGGSVTVESEVGKGTKFTLSFTEK